MSGAPEKIWAWYFIASKRDDVIKGGWDDSPDRKTTEYVRADIHAAEVERSKALAEALKFYADPVVAGSEHVPDHYDALSFGDTAYAALAAYGEKNDG